VFWGFLVSQVASSGHLGAPDRDSLSTREANGAMVLIEEDTAAVTKLLLVWLVVEVREIVGRLPRETIPSVL
jgi:hypothetical protein